MIRKHAITDSTLQAAVDAAPDAEEGASSPLSGPLFGPINESERNSGETKEQKGRKKKRKNHGGKVETSTPARREDMQVIRKSRTVSGGIPYCQYALVFID